MEGIVLTAIVKLYKYVYKKEIIGIFEISDHNLQTFPLLIYC
jgi:hypothetical protein